MSIRNSLSGTFIGGITAGTLALMVSGCGGGPSDSGSSDSTAPSDSGATKTAQGGGAQLTGAGSSFVQPFFQKAFNEYHSKHADVTVNYQANGSGAGIKSLTGGLVDFAASDVPMNAKEIEGAKAQGGDVIQFPVALGAVTVSYNLAGVPSGLKLTPKAIADIFLGKVKNWNDPEIASVNASAKLPAQPIQIVHRADGSGTTYIFTDYLSKISPEWDKLVGKGKDVKWPVGTGAKDNAGVAGQIKDTPGAIGYVELAYVMQTQMTDASIQNKAGQFIPPVLESAKAAAAKFPSITSTEFSIVDAPGADSYPLSGYSWGIMFQKPKDAARGKATADLMKWLVTDAQEPIAAPLNYVPLPKAAQDAATALLGKVQA